MNMEYPIGLASPYFITEADRAIACIRDPAMLICRNRLTLDTFSRFLAFLHRDGPASRAGSSLFKSDKPTAPPSPPLERARRMLHAIAVEKQWPAATDCVFVEEPLVVLGNPIDPDVLLALTVMKLRGFIRSLAVDVSADSASLPALIETLAQEEYAKTSIFMPEGGACIGFRVLSGLAVVSGLRATVIATGLSMNEILHQHPGLPNAPLQ